MILPISPKKQFFGVNALEFSIELFTLKNAKAKCNQISSERGHIHLTISTILLYVYENGNGTIHQRKYNYVVTDIENFR